MAPNLCYKHASQADLWSNPTLTFLSVYSQTFTGMYKTATSSCPGCFHFWMGVWTGFHSQGYWKGQIYKEPQLGVYCWQTAKHQYLAAQAFALSAHTSSKDPLQSFSLKTALPFCLIFFSFQQIFKMCLCRMFWSSEFRRSSRISSFQHCRKHCTFSSLSVTISFQPGNSFHENMNNPESLSR